MKNSLFLLFISITLQASSALAATRAEQINQLFTEYNKRFSTGAYVSDRAQINSFNLQQDALAASFKVSGGLKSALVITNDYDANLTAKLYMIINDDNTLMGFFYEKSSYYDDEERSYVRFKLLSDVEKGLGFVSVNGTYALMVKGFYFKPETGGTLQFGYLTDLNKKSVSALNVFVLFRNNSWGVFNETYQPVTTADVRTWSSFFPPNGGVRQIILR